MPAWVGHDGQRLALKAGAEVQGRDTLVAGGGGCITMQLAEGSTVKLGAQGRLEVQSLVPPERPGGIFRGILNVAKGAFRFTTGALSNAFKRDLRIRIATIAAGIRGTDLWGKVAPDKDMVSFIEAKIQVESQGREFMMADPLSFCIVPKNAPPKPVARVPPEKLTQRFPETDLQQGQGVVTADGVWVVNLMSLREPAEATARLARLEEAGYAAESRIRDLEELKIRRLRRIGRCLQGAPRGA